MNINKQFKFFSNWIGYDFLLSVTIMFTSNQVFAETGTVQLVEKAEPIESSANVNRRHNAILEGWQPTSSLSWTLTADQWEIARNGESILSLAVLNDLVRTWLSSVQSQQGTTRPPENEIIEVHYPGGEEGEVWVQELVDWLVALGIPSRYISIVPGSAAEDEVRFQLLKND